MKGLWKWVASLMFEVIGVLLFVAWAERYINVSHNLFDLHTLLMYFAGRFSLGIADFVR